MVVEDPHSFTTHLNVNNNIFPDAKANSIQKWIQNSENADKERTATIDNTKKELETDEKEMEDEDNNTEYSDYESSDLVLSASESDMLQELANKVTSFGDVCVNNSTDVHLGNKTYFQGPVTIKQIMYTNPVGLPKELQNTLAGVNGVVNSKVLVNGQGNLLNIENGVQSYSDEQHILHFGNGFIPSENRQNVSTNDESLQREGISLKTLLERREIILSILCLFVLILISVMSIGTFLILKHPPPAREGDATSSEDSTVPLHPEDTVDNSNSSNPNNKYPLRLIQRSDWLAQPPIEQLANLTLPIHTVVILHSASESCKDLGDCKVKVRDIQSFHVDGRKWSDIAYNFLVGGDGSAYVGRGWFNMGANVLGYNKEVYGIAFIGTFTKLLPPQRQLEAAKKLIQLGVKEGYIIKEYKLKAHRQFSGTESPGEVLYQEITKWPHFDKAIMY